MGSNSEFGGTIRNRRPIVGVGWSCIPTWDGTFAISCVFGVALDPLFFYVVITNEDMKCLMLDRNVRIIALVLRSVTDVFYMVELIRNLKGTVIEFCADILGYCRDILFNLRAIICCGDIRMPRLLISFFAVVPVPQVKKSRFGFFFGFLSNIGKREGKLTQTTQNQSHLSLKLN